MLEYIITAAIAGPLYYLYIVYQRQKSKKTVRKPNFKSSKESISIHDIQTLNVSSDHTLTSSIRTAPDFQKEKRVELRTPIVANSSDERFFRLEDAFDALKYAPLDKKKLQINLTQEVRFKNQVISSQEMISLLTESAVKNGWMPSGQKLEELGRSYIYRRV